MKQLSGVPLLIWMIISLSGCMSTTPSDLLGVWKITTFTVDGMDRDRVAFNRNGLDDPVEWGSGIEFLSDGTFRTNLGQQGRWQLSKNHTTVLLYTDKGSAPVRWKASVGDELLVLHTTTRRINFSRTDVLPDPPPPQAPNLITNLPGTWYFYRWNDQQDTMLYPSSEKQAHWLTMDWQGSYQSGEGKHRSFQGKWILQENTLQLSDTEQALRQTWHVQLSGDTLFVEPADDTTAWFQALLIRKM